MRSRKQKQKTHSSPDFFLHKFNFSGSTRVRCDGARVGVLLRAARAGDRD
jgi:hypothetical protein